MDIGEAINRSTKDIVKSLVLWVGIFIPIVNFWAIGYFLDVIKTTKKKTIPEFDWVNQFIEGIKGFVIIAIYMFVAVILAIVLMMVGAMLNSGIIVMLASVLSMLIYLVFGLYGFAGLLKFAVTRNIMDGFAFGALTKRVLSVDYYITIIGAAILGWVPVIGPMYSATIYGQLD
ncbi:DUF4013 domain-containing protein [Candidatus Micrarchaeota archaeon]|nr:DUF4013 domain-containing protein [Candidatus Micrarchaeota archaeon]